ncbi:ATP-dependent DNA helicase RecQ [Tessaracoccus bendigoensis DSM 12906]|uniref:DNA 3'-5' helicase n=1 Tax=Tessaracoccus bendigoensis DSM 12906 TaxID=1123357 RepID=A0A1M6H8S0_9ACTN|nr:DEAD/DEAH box helicase [Tessaracoccus bendigoensis]SHJ18483.1 ATP-dependent DNA helicase RecQ [Tessaracoccus bendigoensis DSM 12906]
MTEPWDVEPPPDFDELPPDPWDLPPSDLGEALPRATDTGRAAAPTRGAVARGTVGLRDEALTILRALTGNAQADFHPGQFEAIEALVAEHRRALVVQRTGWGKSAVYFIAALLQRRAGAGPALIVSPLLALMRDQVAAAERAGVRAAAINSSNVTQWADIESLLDSDSIDVLLVSPERLVNPRFRAEQLPRLIRQAGLVVIDEAHCISDWGHDFRPDYRRIRTLIAELPSDVPVLATTATANERVVHDVAEQMAEGGHEVFTLRGPLARESLRLGVLELGTSWRRLAWLAEHLADLPGSGIVYCLTVSSAEETATLLSKAGHRVLAYTGRTDPVDRLAAESALKGNDVKALIATSALGMGFDKPDLGFVVHLGSPSSPVAYYQQVGRAGRATDSADVLLLPGREDREIWHYFATNAMPTRTRADAVLGALSDADRPLSVGALEARVDLRRSQLELLLKVLAVDGVVESVTGGWVSTGVAWVYDSERYERIAEARLAEQRSMIEYQELDGCRMAFLTAALDDPSSAPCGRCDTCAGPWYPTEISADSEREARTSMDRVGVEIPPRLQWPTGLDRLGVTVDGVPVKGKLPVGEVLEEGRVVARLTDLGYGNTLRELFAADRDGRPVDRELPAPLASACLRVLKEWQWHGRPVAVAWIPSLGRPRLVESLGSGLARAGRLEPLGPLNLTAATPAVAANSAFRVRDLWSRFTVPPEMADRLASLRGPVLLVDDLVDSRWTMTIAGRLLRRAGADAVLPFALATMA